TSNGVARRMAVASGGLPGPLGYLQRKGEKREGGGRVGSPPPLCRWGLRQHFPSQADTGLFFAKFVTSILPYEAPWSMPFQRHEITVSGGVSLGTNHRGQCLIVVPRQAELELDIGVTVTALAHPYVAPIIMRDTDLVIADGPR